MYIDLSNGLPNGCSYQGLNSREIRFSSLKSNYFKKRKNKVILTIYSTAFHSGLELKQLPRDPGNVNA